MRSLFRRSISKLPYPVGKGEDLRALRSEYLKDAHRLEALFRADILEDLGLTAHPQGKVLVDLAWDYGHSSGLAEVYNYAEEMAVLLR